MNRSPLTLVAVTLLAAFGMSLQESGPNEEPPSEPWVLVPIRCLTGGTISGTDSTPCAGFSRRQVRF
jgi:hypothetical protein